VTNHYVSELNDYLLQEELLFHGKKDEVLYYANHIDYLNC